MLKPGHILVPTEHPKKAEAMLMYFRVCICVLYILRIRNRPVFYGREARKRKKEKKKRITEKTILKDVSQNSCCCCRSLSTCSFLFCPFCHVGE